MNRTFRLLFGATVVSGVGTWLSVIALTVDVYDRTHSGPWVAALLVADFLPAVAIGLLLGPLVDRLARKRILIAADLSRLCVFAVLVAATSPGQIVALAFVAGIATGFSRPALMAGLPNLVSADDLPRANGLLRSADFVTQTAGTVAGGLLVAASGPDLAYGLNAVSFGVSAILVAAIPAVLLGKGAASGKGHWSDLAAGFAAVRSSRALLAVLIAWSLVMVATGAMNVTEVMLAKVAYDGGDLGFGLMWAGTGVGAAVGALYASSWIERRNVRFVYVAGIGLMALGDLLGAIAPNVWVGAWCIVLGGIGNASAIVCNTLLVQGATTDRVRGRVFTIVMGVNFAVLGLAMGLTGPIVDEVGPRWVWAGAAAIAALGAVAAALLLGRERQPAAAAPARI